MNVQSIHNETFNNELAKLPNGTLGRAADVASWLQYNLFTDSKLDGLGNRMSQSNLVLKSGSKLLSKDRFSQSLVEPFSLVSPTLSLHSRKGATKSRSLTTI